MSSPFRWLAFLGIALADERQTKWLLEHPDADTRRQLRKKRLEAELAAVEAEIDRGYWAFTRQARGKLAPHATYLRRTALKAELRAISVLTKAQGCP